MTAQIPLALPHRVALGGEDFFVSPSNRDAVERIDAWPQWPGGILILTGPAGAGKSHLASVWRKAARADLRACADLSEEDIEAMRAGAALAVEGADRPLDRNRETLLFHLVNACREASLAGRGGGLLLTASDAPGHWPVTLPDLTSRLRAAPLARIGPPDDSLMAALLVKQFADRQLRVGTDLLSYLLPRLERSFAALQCAVERLDAAALAERRAITVPFARKVLGL